MLGIKTTMSEMKNIPVGINCKLDKAEEKTNKAEVTAIELSKIKWRERKKNEE